MHEAEIKGEFSRDQGKFWSIAEPESDTLTFADRGGRSRSVVAVFDPARSDYRLKIWLNGPQSPADFSFDGHVVTLPHRERGFHTGAVDKAALWKILQGQSPLEIDDEDEDEDEDDLRDYCIETRFDLTSTAGRNGQHPGSVASFPEWMRAREISVSGEDTGGSGPQIRLSTDLAYSDPDYVDMCHGLRINGIWCISMPLWERGGKGTVLLIPTPDEAAEIRNYGDENALIELENAPRPPRTRHLHRQLYNFLKETGSTKGMDAWQWRDDIMHLGYALHGMGICWGQMQVWKRKQDQLDARRTHWQQCLNRHFERRPKAYLSYTRGAWVDEVGGEPKKWSRYETEIRGAISQCGKDIVKFQAKYEEQRQKYEERLSRIEVREAKYADAIALIQPREGEDVG